MSVDFETNKILNEKEMKDGKLGLNSSLRRLIVTLSSRCNINCIMCEVRRSQWDISEKSLQEIIGFFPYIESLIWQGGETFILGYFEELFDEARKFPDLRQTIVTNGLLITETWAEKLAGSNVELVFSIDGVTKEVYEQVRVGAKFDDVVRAIKIVSEARSPSAYKGMSLRLHAVIMRSNYQQLEAFVDFAREYGFDAIHFIAIWGNLDSDENIFYRREKEALNYIRSVRNKIAEKAQKYNIQLLNSLPDYNDDSQGLAQDTKAEGDGLFCQLPWMQLNIDPGGGVRPGCLCPKTVGNILEKDLKEIWNGPEIQLYREKILKKDYSSWCSGGCVSGQISKELRGM